MERASKTFEWTNESIELVKHFNYFWLNVEGAGCMKGGSKEIKEHKWFAGMDWDAVYRGQVMRPSNRRHVVVYRFIVIQLCIHSWVI